MNDVVGATAAIPFIVGHHSLFKHCGRLFLLNREQWLVLCAATKCLSLVDTETVAGVGRPDLVVGHCLLWPTLQGCDQRCVK